MKYIFLLLFIILGIGAKSQNKQANVWFFGDSAGLDFNFSPPKYSLSSELSILEGSSTIADEKGKLLYVMDYYGVYDSNFKLLKNGVLNGDLSSTQSSLILKIGNRFAFMRTISDATTNGYGCDFFKLSTSKYDSLILGFTNLVYKGSEKMTALNHQGSNGVFVISVQGNTNDIYTYYIDINLNTYCPKIYNFNKNGANWVGQMKASNSGLLLANSEWVGFNKSIQLYKFNSSNGIISNYKAIRIPWQGSAAFEEYPYGLEFSPSGDFLYVTTRESNLYQIDLTKADSNKFDIVKITSRYDPNFYGLMDQLQLGPDGKIYIAQHDSFYLCTIDSPNIKGLGCAYRLNSVYLGGRKSLYGLPNFNQSYFYTPSINYTYDLDCRTNTIQFQGKDTFGATQFTYRIVDSTGNLASISLVGARDTQYIFLDTGKYKIWFIASNGVRTDSILKTIQVLPIVPQGYLGNDTFACFPDSSLVLKAPLGLHCYQWSNGVSSASNPINQTGIYTCIATDDNFCSVRDTIVVINDTLKSNYTIQRQNNGLFVGNVKPNLKYLWYLQDSLYSTDSVFIFNKKGAYHAVVLEQGRCTQITDTFTVDTVYYFAPPINFSYTLNCATHYLTATAIDTFNADSFNWKISQVGQADWFLQGKQIDTTLADSGWVSITVIAKLGAREETKTDSFYNLPKVKPNFLGNDTLLCYPNTSLILTAPTRKQSEDSFTYLWSTQETTQTIVVKDSTLIWCAITGTNKCTAIDSIHILMDTIRTVKLMRVHDTLIAINSPTNLQNPNYHWYRNGSGLITLLVPKLTIKDTGSHYLIITSDSLCPIYSDTLQIDSLYGTNIANIIALKGLKIYPNPAQDYLTIDWQGTETLALQLFDALGKEVLTETILPKTKQQLDVSKLPKGVYLLQVNGEYGFKLILND